MNRFHLLSLQEEEESVIIIAPAEPPKIIGELKPVSLQKSASAGSLGREPHKGVKREEARSDRRPRGTRKASGEKHETVGKGSWGRPTEGATLEEAATDAALATDENAIKVLPVAQTVYKTVQQYLKEQEEQKSRLQARSTLKPRRENEGH